MSDTDNVIFSCLVSRAQIYSHKWACLLICLSTRLLCAGTGLGTHAGYSAQSVRQSYSCLSCLSAAHLGVDIRDGAAGTVLGDGAVGAVGGAGA